MSRFKKFLYAYFSIILAFFVISLLGAKTIGGDMSPIEYLFSSPQVFGCTTLVIFVVSLFL